MSKGAVQQDEYAKTLRQCYGTPYELFAGLHKEFKFTIDAMANEENKKLDRYWSPADDALMQDWTNERPFINPPFNMIGISIAVSWEAVQAGCERVVLLGPPRTGTDWWRDYASRATYIDYFRSRIDFIPPEELVDIYEAKGKDAPASNAEDMCLVILERGRLDLSAEPRPRIRYRNNLDGSLVKLSAPAGQLFLQAVGG
jgi:phage N-6-adenine-methyltransferase